MAKIEDFSVQTVKVSQFFHFSSHLLSTNQTMDLYLLLIFFICGSFGEEKSHHRIYNGRDAKDNEFPYMAQIIAQGRCGGVLISKSFVLTAAHCLYKFSGDLIVVLGHNKRKIEKSKFIEVFKKDVKYWSHEKYDPKTFANDISIIKLPYAATLSEGIKPIKLSTNKNINKNKVRVILSGFGVISKIDNPIYLQTAEFTLLPLKECKLYQGNFGNIPITDDNVCALGDNTKTKIVTACNGDSGLFLISIKSVQKTKFRHL